jgi:hypothetical protein
MESNYRNTKEAQIIEQKHVLVLKMCALVEYCTAQNQSLQQSTNNNIEQQSLDHVR